MQVERPKQSDDCCGNKSNFTVVNKHVACKVAWSSAAYNLTWLHVCYVITNHCHFSFVRASVRPFNFSCVTNTSVSCVACIVTESELGANISRIPFVSRKSCYQPDGVLYLFPRPLHAFQIASNDL